MADINTARDLLLALIYPVTSEDMNETQAAEFEIAAGDQLDYTLSYAGEIKSESVGDVSVTYDCPAKNSRTGCYGQPISPSAVARLARCGLLRRWV